MSVAVFKAALCDRDPQIRRAIREVPQGTYTAVELRELLQAVEEVYSDSSLHRAWPDCLLTRSEFAPKPLSAAEFKARLIDPDPAVRRSVWLTMHDKAFMTEDSSYYFFAVLKVLRSQDCAYAWPDCRIALDGFRSWADDATLWLLTRVLASSTGGLGEQLASSTGDLGEQLASIIGLPEDLYPPRWPVPITESGSVQCYFCTPDAETREESAADCLQVCTLVMLLSCSIEALRVKARDELVRLGPGAAGILRQLRRTSFPGRCAALETLAYLGWDEVDPADRALIDRFLRMQRVGEVAQPVPGAKGMWYAIPTTDQAAVLDAFDLCDPVEVSLRAGFAMCNLPHRQRMVRQRVNLDWAGTTSQTAYANHYPEVFVTPALDGWTLVFYDDMLDEHDEHAHRRCAELSRRFGTTHWYNHPTFYNYNEWCIAEDGAIVYHVKYAGGILDDSAYDEVQIGPRRRQWWRRRKRTIDDLRAWLDANSRNEPPPLAQPTLVPPNIADRLLQIAITGTDPGEAYHIDEYTDTDTDDSDRAPLEYLGYIEFGMSRVGHRLFEFGVSRIAHRLSVGLETLGPHTRIEGTGVLAVRADPRPPQRYGAPAWSRR